MATASATRAARRRWRRRSQRTATLLGQVLIYGALIFWAFVSLFPIYWTITTSFKMAKSTSARAI